MSRTITIRLDDETEIILQELMTNTNRSQSNLVRAAIRDSVMHRTIQANHDELRTLIQGIIDRIDQKEATQN